MCRFFGPPCIYVGPRVLCNALRLLIIADQCTDSVHVATAAGEESESNVTFEYSRPTILVFLISNLTFGFLKKNNVLCLIISVMWIYFCTRQLYPKILQRNENNK